MFTINGNRDEGSLKVGLTAGDKKWNEGDKIQILGEAKVRTVTFVMGKGDKTCLCFKGQGKVPTGDVQYTLVGAGRIEEAA